MTPYQDFLRGKAFTAPSVGIDVAPDALHPALFDFQRAITAWALRKGRAAIWADTGTGKTVMQLEWARHAAERVLILAPLGVARQTVREAERLGLTVIYARKQADAPLAGITITNYEMLPAFDAAAFGAVVLDESHILANFTGKTKRELIATFRATPMRLCCTATPAPNDTVELGNHADFLGVMPPNEIISTFFLPEETAGKYRLKRHARQRFYRWLASWAVSMKRPSDLGFSDEGYDLPSLDIQGIYVPTDYVPPGYLFPVKLHGVTDRAAVRRGTLADRVAATVKLVQAEPSEQWLIWTGLNDEANALARALPGAVNLMGADTPEHKAEVLHQFAAGQVRVLITKVTIAGLGLNFQACARMIFCGIGDSYVQYYQGIRRCWRYGQTRPVRVWIVLSDQEQAVYDNVLRKEYEARALATELVANMTVFERAELRRQADLPDPLAPRADALCPAWLAPIDLPAIEEVAV